MDRRDFLLGGLVTGALLVNRQSSAQTKQPPLPGGIVPVVTPNGSTLPWRVVNGVKVGHLIANEFEHEFAPGLKAMAWGYNGNTPGPTIEAIEGDHVRLYVTNRLQEPTTVHWHGVILPNGMDGVSGLNQKPIPPGSTFVYEFTFKYPGTFMYHSHHDEMTQIALGMVGMIVVHPKAPRGQRVARDFALMTHEMRIDAGARRPNPLEMVDFNVLTFNGKAFPGTEPLVVGLNERIRIRLGNLSPQDHHPIHLHGVAFHVVGTDGGVVVESARSPETTVIVPVGATRVIECSFEEPGDWAMHCHMTHHVMTQMGHGAIPATGADFTKLDKRLSRVEPQAMSMGQHGMGDMMDMNMPVPANSIPMRPSPGPFSPIEMGGMFTVIKVREKPNEADPKGWYKHPPEKVARLAETAQMSADGIDPNAK